MKNITKKRILAITLALALTISLCGCQANHSNENTSPTEISTSCDIKTNAIDITTSDFISTSKEEINIKQTTTFEFTISDTCNHNWIVAGYAPNGLINEEYTHICSYECTKCLTAQEKAGKCTIADEGLWCPYCGQNLNNDDVSDIDESYDVFKENSSEYKNTSSLTDISSVNKYITNYTSAEIKADASIFGLGEVTSAYDHSHYVVGKLEGTTLTITRNGSESDGKLATISRVTDFKKITKVVIEPGIEIIDGYAFENCENLVNIELPDTLTEIGRYAFLNCFNLHTVELPDSVTSLGYATFMNCTSLKNITLSNGLKTLSDAAFFNCSSLESVTIPDNITVIAMQAFTNCSNLSSVEFSKNLTWIGFSAFANCTALASIELPEALKTIDKYAFQGCTNLKSATIRNAEKILGGVFKNCENLQMINFEGTEAEWNNVAKRDAWDENTGNYIVRCVDKDITK